MPNLKIISQPRDERKRPTTNNSLKVTDLPLTFQNQATRDLTEADSTIEKMNTSQTLFVMRILKRRSYNLCLVDSMKNWGVEKMNISVIVNLKKVQIQGWARLREKRFKWCLLHKMMGIKGKMAIDSIKKTKLIIWRWAFKSQQLYLKICK